MHRAEITGAAGFLVRFISFAAVALVLLAGGCATKLPPVGVTPLKPATLAELHKYLLSNKPDMEVFALRGPFAVKVQKNLPLRLSGALQFEGDLYLSGHGEKAPLVILLHGYDNSKEDHAYQAMHLASWGIHCLSLQLPAQGPWLQNGSTLAGIVKLVRSRPELLDARIDAERIVLAGHSFGGAAVAVALAEGAPAAGGVLLDAAAVGNDMPKLLRRIGKPVMLIGADETLSGARHRGIFYESIRADVAEVSITGAYHEDAEFPLDSSGEVSPENEAQLTFVSALTSAAFSIAVTGKLDYVWTSFGGALRSGKLYDGLRK